MKIWLNNYFGISKGEFNGLLVLITLIVFLKASPFVYERLKKEEPVDAAMLAQIQKLSIQTEAGKTYAPYAKNTHPKKVPQLFKFDPNTLNLKGWQDLGLSAKQAQSILNYRNKGGRFNRPEDVQKMYTISPVLYQKIHPFIVIEKGTEKEPKGYLPFEKKNYTKKELVVVDVNLADSAQLDEIKGIGPAFAQRILKYRERLGGFYKKEQLMEVYGLDSAKYFEIEKQITITTSNVKKINVNTGTFNEFRTNPYLSFKQINAIIQYRKQHGNYTSIADLKKVALLNAQVIEKIAPYISF